MSDFEVCPIGTQARLAAVEVERDALKADAERLSDVVSKVNKHCDHLGIRLGEVIAERDALLSALLWIDKRCPQAFMDCPLHTIHREMAHDAGACARAAIKAVEGEKT